MPALIRLNLRVIWSSDTISVKVQSGSNTFTIGEGSDATTVTDTRKHVYSENWAHYGGKEVYDGETVQWNATGSVVRPRLMLAALLRRLVKVLLHIVFSVMAAQVRFIIVKRPGMASTVKRRRRHTTMLDGTKLGSSWSGSSTWQDGDGNTITNASTNYNGPDWEWLGSSWSDTDADGNVLSSGSNFETVVAKYQSNGSTLTLRGHHLHRNLPGFRMLMVHYHLLDADGVKLLLLELMRVLPPGRKVRISVTETRKYIMSDNWDHLGGKEVRDGQTTQFSANWGARCEFNLVRRA